MLHIAILTAYECCLQEPSEAAGSNLLAVLSQHAGQVSPRWYVFVNLFATNFTHAQLHKAATVASDLFQEKGSTGMASPQVSKPHDVHSYALWCQPCYSLLQNLHTKPWLQVVAVMFLQSNDLSGINWTAQASHWAGLKLDLLTFFFQRLLILNSCAISKICCWLFADLLLTTGDHLDHTHYLCQQFKKLGSNIHHSSQMKNIIHCSLGIHTIILKEQWWNKW